jgi:GNAT superfamily N-acetyltransferase
MHILHHNEYEILSYSNEFFPEVIDLQKYLWPSYTKTMQNYFKWKFQDNPINRSPFGVVALFQGRVVGFKGFFVTRWAIETSDNVLMLSPADICVHPEHRKKGLFKSMNDFAIEEYENSEYRAFIALSVNTSSSARYGKMGWIKIASRVNLRQYKLSGLINWIYSNRTGKSLHKQRVKYGKFNNIEVSNEPRPEEMHNILISQKNPINKITLFEDLDFLKWRFLNIRRKYFFYYRFTNEKLDGYLIIENADNSTSGHIMDFAEKNEGTIIKLLEYVVKENHFDILSIWNINLNNKLSKILEDLHFSTNNLIGKIEKKFHSEFPALPIMVRPIKKIVKEDDWFIQGIDIRDINNWQIRRICSDNT